MIVETATGTGRAIGRRDVILEIELFDTLTEAASMSASIPQELFEMYQQL